MDECATLESTISRVDTMQSLLAFPFEANDALVHDVDEGAFKIRAAESWGARHSASMLISRLYGRRGYRNNPLPAHPDLNQLTLVASAHDALVGTMTVRFDSDERLLADDLFPDEVNALRECGRQICEFTKLAVDGLVRSQRVLAAMFHVAFIHAHRIRGCDNLLIEVNPRHVRYYETKLGFTRSGPERLNRRVNAPAVLLSLDLWYAHEQIKKLGGRPELSAVDRSLYPYGFSCGEEAGIVGRLRKQQLVGSVPESFSQRARS